jgi:ABC-2 type transport system permease protein
MTAVANDTWQMTLRHLRALIRQPIWIFVTLVQPVIWLLLFGALFEKVTEIPGFTSGNYIDFLAPGVVVMTAFFSAGWSGMSMIEDLDRGVVDRFLTSPVNRSSLIAGRIVQQCLTIVIQSVIIVGLALLAGGTFPGGVGGVVVLLLIGCLVGASFAALSNGIALLVRKEESLIGILTFVQLPLTFVSSAFMQQDLMPGWMSAVADVNPVNWAVDAGRSAVSADPDWGLIATDTGLLLALLAASLWMATRAFRTYQKQV